MTRLTYRRGTAIAALACVLLSACGGDDGGDTNASERVEDATTTTIEDSTSTTDTTVATESATTETTLDTGTTLPAATPTTVRQTATTVRGTKATTTTTTTRNGSGGAGTSTTVAGAVNKGTIKIGNIYSSINANTGAATLKEPYKIGQAWQDMVNAAGGINGYKIQIVFRDIQGDTSRSVQAVKDLDGQGVLAIAGHDAQAQLPASDKYLNDHKLPVVGGTPYVTEFDFDPMYFPVSAGFYAGVYGNVAAVRDSGARSAMQLYCSEAAACASAVSVWRVATEREGIRWQAQSASAVAPDYTAACLRAKDFGAEFIQNAGLNQANLVRDCARQNYHPIYGVGGAANQATIDATKGDRLAGALYEFGVFYDGPEVQRFRKALATTDLVASSATPPTQTSVQAWLGFEMAGAAIKRLTQANPTRQDFLNALYSIKGENLGGQIAPVDYTVQRPGTGGHAGNDCWTEHTVNDGKYVHMNKSGQPVSRLTFICGSGKTYTSQPPS